MNTELHYVDNLKNVTASCEGWRKPLLVLWTCNPASQREASIFKPQSLRRALSTKALPASRSVYIVLLQSWETLFIFHSRRTASPSQGSRRGFEGPLPSTRAALFCIFTAEREKLLWPQGACFEGTSLQVKILLVSSYRALAPRSPSNLPLWGHAVVGQTAKGMESPRLQLLRLLGALVFIGWTCYPLTGVDVFRNRFLTACHASCYLKTGTTWGQYKYILWETEVESPSDSFVGLTFFVLVIFLGFNFWRQMNQAIQPYTK